MKIYTRLVLDMETGEHIEERSYEYNGPIEKCDRSAQNEAKQAQATASGVAGGYGSGANAIAGNLIPTLNYQLQGNAGLTPTQKNNLLVAGQQGAGGATGSIAGQAGLNAQRTRNSGALSGVLDQAARSRQQASSQAALGVENESTKLAAERQAQAQQQLQGLYGTDVSAQLGAMGIQNKDIEAQIEAGKSGWLQNTMGVLGTLGGIAGATKGPTSGW